MAIKYIEENVVHTGKHPRPRILVKERWTSRLWIVFDIFNNSYDPDTAYLPVTMVSFGEKDTISTNKAIEAKVNNSVRETHDIYSVGS